MNATVYISGHDLGTHPYGYTSFSHDLTAHLRPGGNNVLANRPGHPLSGGHLMSIRRAVERLLAPVRKRRMDRELESEIAAYLELAELDALHRGPSPKPKEARRGPAEFRRNRSGEGAPRPEELPVDGNVGAGFPLRVLIAHP